MLGVLENLVDYGSLGCPVEIPGGLTMDLIQMWPSVWEFVASSTSFKLGLWIALKHVSDLNAAIRVVPLLSPAHNLEGLLRSLLLGACDVLHVDTPQRGDRVIKPTVPIASQWMESWLTEGRALAVERS